MSDDEQNGYDTEAYTDYGSAVEADTDYNTDDAEPFDDYLQADKGLFEAFQEHTGQDVRASTCTAIS
jgi:hypothetical protein